MQRELWTREELGNAILATYFAGVVAPASNQGSDSFMYSQGFRAALTALALNFGLPPLCLPPVEGRASDRPRLVGGEP